MAAETEQRNRNPKRIGGGETLPGRNMPESSEAEAAVLGSMILDRECIGQVVQSLTAESFYRSEYRDIFEALISLYEKNSAIDLVVLRDELIKRNKLSGVGGAEFLVSVADSVPSSANVDYYLEIVRDKWMLRQLASAGNEMDASQERLLT